MMAHNEAIIAGPLMGNVPYFWVSDLDNAMAYSCNLFRVKCDNPLQIFVLSYGIVFVISLFLYYFFPSLNRRRFANQETVEKQTIWNTFYLQF